MIELTIEIRTPQTPTAPAPTSQWSLPTQQTGLRTAALSSNIKLQTVFSISNHQPLTADCYLSAFDERPAAFSTNRPLTTGRWPLPANYLLHIQVGAGHGRDGQFGVVDMLYCNTLHYSH